MIDTRARREAELAAPILNRPQARTRSRAVRADGSGLTRASGDSVRAARRRANRAARSARRANRGAK